MIDSASAAEIPVGRTAFIGLGSNLSEPVLQLKQAISALKQQEGILSVGCSSLYRSTPMGPKNQPEYINAVAKLVTTLSPQALLLSLQGIENTQGRIRIGERWGARTLDLDILLYENLEIQLPELTLPHYGMTEREFVLYPLYEIAPDLTIPGKGKLSELLKVCPLNGLERITYEPTLC